MANLHSNVWSMAYETSWYPSFWMKPCQRSWAWTRLKNTIIGRSLIIVGVIFFGGKGGEGGTMKSSFQLHISKTFKNLSIKEGCFVYFVYYFEFSHTLALLLCSWYHWKPLDEWDFLEVISWFLETKVRRIWYLFWVSFVIRKIMKRFFLNQSLGLEFQTHIFYQFFFLWEKKQVIFIFINIFNLH
jgi:hypothetical protein